MYTFLLVLYVIVAIVMSIVILLQSGKGGMGAIGGGSSTGSVFGGGGAEAFLNKLTTYLAIAFIGLSIILVKSTSKDKSTLAAKYANKGSKGAITKTIKKTENTNKKENKTKEDKK